MKRILIFLFALAILVSSNAINIPKAEAATYVWGIAENSATWYPGGGVSYTFHWRFAVERDTVVVGGKADFRIRARFWCDYSTATSGPFPTPCNYDIFDYYFIKFNCNNFPCTTGSYGPGNKEVNNDTEWVLLGGWHFEDATFGYCYQSKALSMRAKFLTPNHVTNTYSGASQVVKANDGSDC